MKMIHVGGNYFGRKICIIKSEKSCKLKKSMKKHIVFGFQ